MCENQEVDQKLDQEADQTAEQDMVQEDPVEELKKQLQEANLENVKISDEVVKLRNEFETVRDRFARTVAEYENYRKRTTKEKEGIYTAACEDILKAVLPVLDNLERAAEVDGSVEDLKKGIDMTVKQFRHALETLQVEEIPTADGFDPNFHEAVMHVFDENLGQNAVADVFQKGYKRGDKVLRCSMVKVAN
ncbi:MAG: GrpE protein [Firmicutes bacterium]|nr:GrpE protein [Bacillota bacterium]